MFNCCLIIGDRASVKPLSVFFKKYLHKYCPLTLTWILRYYTLISRLNAKLGYATNLIVFLKIEPRLSFYNHNSLTWNMTKTYDKLKWWHTPSRFKPHTATRPSRGGLACDFSDRSSYTAVGGRYESEQRGPITLPLLWQRAPSATLSPLSDGSVTAQGLTGTL